MDKTFMECHGYTYYGAIGKGMFGKVVKAYSSHRRRLVAVKIIDLRKVNTTYKQKFLVHEKNIMKCVKHPNIVRTFEIFESPIGTVYMVMENCPKGDLATLITVKGYLDEEFATKLLRQLCLAVQYLHDMDVAHRDIKCENLLLDTNYNLKVCDFGLSKTITYTSGRMVLSKTFCGTSSYAAPELLKNCPYNPKMSDVWSIGIVLYMMLFGCMPFSTTNIAKMIKKQMNREFIFPSDPLISVDAKNLIHSILHPVVEHRISISQILESSWLTCEKPGNLEKASSMAGSSGATSSVGTSSGGGLSSAGSSVGLVPDVQTKGEDGKTLKAALVESSDAEEGPSSARSRKR